jgi:phosphinothricin acetyltransferase
VRIRPASGADAEALAGIYNPYVSDTIITFETEAVSPAEMERRRAAVVATGRPWLVAEVGGEVAGYAYAGAWKTRAAYDRSVESTIYLAPGQGGRGLGFALYGALIDELRAIGVHAVIGGIALPNAASIALHEKLGFRKIGQFVEVGFKFDRWIDVGYWERLL